MVTISDGQTDSIATLLAAFDNDAVAAVQAVRSYAYDTRPAQQTTELRQKSDGPVIIDIKEVKKSYKVGKQNIDALSDISLQIREGEFVALTGASGSGKSTLLQLIGGLDKPTSGTVTVAGSDIKSMRDGALAQFRNTTVGFVFQSFYLQPFLNVGTNVAVPAMFAGSKQSQRQAAVKELVEAVGLTERIDHLPRELSGGQIQRAAVARALVNRPKILLADEPTGNLDSKNGQAIIELFQTIRKTYGTTIIVVTHDAAVAAKADREIRLHDGVVA